MLVLSLARTWSAGAQTMQQGAVPSAPAPTPTFDPARMAKPLSSSTTTQIEQGSLVYWGVCMACHGDQGQGMTDDWRSAYGLDANCWQSQCHGPHHPEEGFEIPRELYFPALANTGSLARFLTAKDMHDFILANMPWWNPASLTADEAWQLTAYVLKMKGVLPGRVILSEANGAEVLVRQLAPRPDDHIAESALAGALLLASLGLVLQSAWPRPTSASDLDQTTGPAANGVRVRPNFFAHLHPPAIPASQARWRYTLGAGGLGVFLCIVLVTTGLLEMFYYKPSPDQAGYSIQTITFLVPYGGFVRNLHYWAAQVLVVVAVVHLLRVVFTGASAARRFNYLLGLSLLLTILFFDFTGYALRWDEGVRWALVAGTNLIKAIPVIGEGAFRFMIGGSSLGPAALLHFYTWHIYGLGIIGGIFLVWHLFRVRRDGGIAAPQSGSSSTAGYIDRSDLVRREVLVMLVAGGLLVLLSAFVRAPIALPIRDNVIQMTEARAPWFFLWVQQLLRQGNAFLWGVLVPLLVILTLALSPYLLPRPHESQRGRWFPRGGRAAQVLTAVIFLILLVLTVLGFLNANG
jgi:quinol-cytochrome oxidoreductase complex cytochrome b subunit